MVDTLSKVITLRCVRHTVPGSIYIGRGGNGKRQSILHNPFPLFKDTLEQRVSVLTDFKHYFKFHLDNKNPEFLAEIDRLTKRAIEKGELSLGCFCSPKPCHGDVILEHIATVLSRMGYNTVIENKQVELF